MNKNKKIIKAWKGRSQEPHIHRIRLPMGYTPPPPPPTFLAHFCPNKQLLASFGVKFNKSRPFGADEFCDFFLVILPNNLYKSCHKKNYKKKGISSLPKEKEEPNKKSIEKSHLCLSPSPSTLIARIYDESEKSKSIS